MKKTLLALAGLAVCCSAVGAMSFDLDQADVRSLVQNLNKTAEAAPTATAIAVSAAQCQGIAVPPDPNNVPVPNDFWDLAFPPMKLFFMASNGHHVLSTMDVLSMHGALWEQGTSGQYITNQLAVDAYVNGWPDPRSDARGRMRCSLNFVQNPNTCAWAPDNIEAECLDNVPGL